MRGGGEAGSDRAGPLQAWVLAARPRTLPAAAAPVLLGSACAAAAGGFRPGPALAALMGALAIQVGTNLVNDVADFARGADREDRLGPLRVTQAGLLTPRQVRWGAAVAFALATLAGLYLWWVAGWPVVVIGLAAIAAGVAYTAGPFPLAYHGLGEPFVFAFFGLVAVAGTAWVQALTVPPAAWWGGAVCGFFATAILVVNNTRDWTSDRRAGRRTLPAVWGRRAGVAQLGACLALAYAASAGGVAAKAFPTLALLALATAPWAVQIFLMVKNFDDGPRLNRALAATGRLLLVHSLLLGGALVVG